MPPPARAFALLLAGTLAGTSLIGCVARDRDLPAEHSRFGALGEVVLVETGPIDPAELLAVADSGLFIIYERRISLTPYRAIQSATFPRTASRPLLRDGRPPGDSVRVRLMRLARFPDGLPAQRLDSLLKAYGQTELGVLPR